MDNDLPEEPNDYMAAAYAELAHQARLRVNALEAMQREEFISQVELAVDDSKETAGRLDNLARLYAERRELTTGYRR